MQSYNTNATSWALASYLYKIGGRYELVPVGLAVGAAAVVIHRVIYHVRYLCSSLLYLKLTSEPNSSYPRSVASTFPKSTCLSSSSLLATSPTTRARLVSSSASLSAASLSSFISETTVHASSRTTRTWSPVPSTEPVLLCSSFSPLQCLALAVPRTRFHLGGETILTGTTIFVLLLSKEDDIVEMALMKVFLFG